MAAVVYGIYAASGCRPRESDSQVAVTKAETGDVEEIDATGTAVSDEQKTLFSRKERTDQKRILAEGDTVSKGNEADRVGSEAIR